MDDDGNKKRDFKQETLFNVDDYKTVVNYHVRLTNHHQAMAEGYVECCEKKHQVQLSLWDLGEGVDEQLELDAEWTETQSSSPGKPR